MTDTSIRVSTETKRRLELAKREGESFDDVIRRLASTDRWAGFGVLADAEGGTREGMTAIRTETREGVARDLERMGSE